jgi:hypothetical protein
MAAKKPAKYTKPEDLTAVDDADLETAQNAALDEYSELAKIADEEITDEQLDRMEELKADIAEIKGERTARVEAAEVRTQRIAEAKSAPPEEDDADDEGDDEEEADEAELEDEAEEETEKVPALVAAGKRAPVARRAARKAKPVEADEEEAPVRKASIVASADVRGFTGGQELDMESATSAFIARVAGMPGGGTKRVGSTVNKYGVAMITKPAEERYAAFSVDTKDSDGTVMDRLFRASRESNLGQSLVAAGGWCAPSENFYDLCQWETTSGGLDLAEITVTRGGINFTKGPDFSTIYGDTGFLQTETQAESGTAKTFLEVECPDWSEVRLDAIGYGVKAPILTASPAGYPELVRRYLEGALVAHWHIKNAYKINKVLGMLGSAANFAELGSGTGDLLYAIEIAAQSLRYKFRLGENATLEAMFPMWVRSALRADLSYRTGVDMLAVTDGQINSWFTMRGIRPQYVYDWASQELTGTQTAFPASVQFGIWPAGTFVVGTNNIISLDAIYDSTEITTNTYTAAFFEEAILVANTCGNGRLFEVALNLHGRTGANDLGASAGS